MNSSKKIERLLDPFDLPYMVKLNPTLDIIKKYINKNTLILFDEYEGKIFSFLSYDNEDVALLEYILSIGANPNTIYYGFPIIFDFISGEKQNFYDDPSQDLIEDKVKLLVENGANINYIAEIYNTSPFYSKKMYINMHFYGDYINKSDKITPLDQAILFVHIPAKNYLLSIGAKTARELEKEEILSKKERNEYEELIYNCFIGNLEKVKSQIKPEYEKGFEGYIYSPIIASLESSSQELMSFLLKYTIDIIFSNEENKVKFQDKNLFKSYLRNLFYESYLKYHEKIMKIYEINFEQNLIE